MQPPWPRLPLANSQSPVRPRVSEPVPVESASRVRAELGLPSPPPEWPPDWVPALGFSAPLDFSSCRTTSRSTTASMLWASYRPSPLTAAFTALVSRRSSSPPLTRAPPPHQPLPDHAVKHFLVRPFFSTNQRRKHQQPRALRIVHHRIHNLRGRLAGDRPAAHIAAFIPVPAARLAHAGKQQAQVIVNLGGRRDRRARVVAGGTLFDGDGRRQSLDRFDVWASAIARETAGRRPRGSRHISAAPPHKLCRRPACSCRCPKGR